MITQEELKVGTQIVYVPGHAKDESDPCCEQGFVTNVMPQGAFCRYWNRKHPGRLRTTANSELTPFRNLVIKNTHPQHDVDILLKGFGYI